MVQEWAHEGVFRRIIPQAPIDEPVQITHEHTKDTDNTHFSTLTTMEMQISIDLLEYGSEMRMVLEG